MPAKPSILILYLSVGSGHQVAAQALAEALRREAPGIRVTTVDPFANSIEVLPAIIEAFQTASITLTPGIVESLWRRGTSGDLRERLSDFSLLQDFLLEELEKSKATCVIATHALPCILAKDIKVQGQAVEHVWGSVTDFGLHTFWPTKDIDGYFVAHEEIRRTFIYRGVDPERVYATGIPIRLGFERFSEMPPSISKGKLRVLLTAGGLRSSGYLGLRQYFFNLLGALKCLESQGLELTIVTGSQRRLAKELTRYVESAGQNCEVLGMVPDMYNLMAEHDVLVTKPGGLTVSEGLASSLCLVMFRPNPGQEAANVDFLARHGAALRGESAEEVKNAIQRLIDDPEFLLTMKTKAGSLGSPLSARKAARLVLDQLRQA